jgi:uncharacterized membrane protein
MNVQKPGAFARIKNYIKADPFILVIALFFAIFAVYWSEVSILKFYALHASIFDLGLAMQNAWTFMYHPLLFYPNMILWVIFPVFLPQSFPLILAFQAIFITMGVFPVYGIAKHMLKAKLPAFFIALSYLLYPYLAGMYWFDFHYQALFPTLFLIGYYLYLKTRYKTAFVILILAGLTRYPYIFFIILLSFLMLIESGYLLKYKKSEFDSKRLRFEASLFFAAFIVFILSYIGEAGTATITQSMTGNAHFMGGLFFSGIDFKLFVLYILFIPLLGLPLFSRRFVLMLAPFIFVLFSANYWAYLFPDFLHLQYGPLIVPFLYLGTIDAIQRIFEKRDYKKEKKLLKRLKSVFSDPRVKVAATILIFMILFATVYQPYGPLNEYSMTNYDEAQNTAVNWTNFNNLEHIVSLVPKSDPYVLTQNNIPELYPRALLPGTYYNSLMDLQFMDFSDNITASNHYLNTSSGLVNARIDYVLADLNSPLYLSTTPSMYDFTSILYGSEQYGIAGEASGFVLLERNYTGPIKYYAPLTTSYNYTQLYPGNDTRLWHGALVANNTQNETLWSTPAMNLPPGEYNVTIEVRSNSSLPSNLIKVQASAFGVPLISSVTVKSIASTWENITLKFILYNFYTSVKISAYSVHWSGSISVKNVVVHESVPFSRFGQFFAVNNDTMIAVTEAMGKVEHNEY